MNIAAKICPASPVAPVFVASIPRCSSGTCWWVTTQVTTQMSHLAVKCCKKYSFYNSFKIQHVLSGSEHSRKVSFSSVSSQKWMILFWLELLESHVLLWSSDGALNISKGLESQYHQAGRELSTGGSSAWCTRGGCQVIVAHSYGGRRVRGGWDTSWNRSYSS